MQEPGLLFIGSAVTEGAVVCEQLDITESFEEDAIECICNCGRISGQLVPSFRYQHGSKEGQGIQSQGCGDQEAEQ